MTASDASGTKFSRKRRNAAPWILGASVLLLAMYYAIVAASGILETSTDVPIAGNNEVQREDYLTLQMRVQDVDLTNRVLLANILPIPHGDLVGDKGGEMSESVRIEVSSGGVTSTVLAYPGESIVDPTAISLLLDRGDSTYPFDRPFADFQLSVQNDETGRSVPFVVEMSNSARPWVLTASVGAAAAEASGQVYPVTIDGHRDALSVTLVAFYVLVILLTTLMAVVIIGGAILRRNLEFANVIWLSATMLSFPALRAAMPGAPPIGTALDFIVLFPCIALIAVMLVWTGGYLLWRESSILRRGELDDDALARPAGPPVLESLLE